MRKIFKRKVWIDFSGNRCKAHTSGAKRETLPNWYFRLSVNGRERWFRGYSDKQATMTLMNETIKRIARGEQGLEDKFKKPNSLPLSQHIADYATESRGNGNDPEWVYTVTKRLDKMADACGWNRLPDITTLSFLRFRDTSPVAKLSPTTRHQYQQVIQAFCRWCVRTGRMPVDPFQHLAHVKSNGDVRRQRRALTDSEVQRFLTSTPEPRRTVYMAALLTGLRRAELEQLRWPDVHLDSPKPYLDVRASTTKNGQRAVVWLRDDLVTALRSMDRSGDAVFDVPGMDVFKADLAKAEIASVDKEGRIVDFHALRHTLATNLGKVGVSVQTAMQVMRHSDIRLTTKTYTDASLLPTAEAIESLPRWEVRQDQQSVKTGTDDTGFCATPCATVFRALEVISGHNVTQPAHKGDIHQTRMNIEETRDYQGDSGGHGKLHQLGLEPRTR